MSIREKIDELNSMILQGQVLEAFDKFYADDVQMRENTDEPRVGKAACRAYEEYFVSNLTGWNGAEVRAVATGDDVSMVEWFMDFSFQNQPVKRTQVAVQRWKDGKIVSETFYYNN